MFEARLVQGNLLKKIVESIRDLVSDANLDCKEAGLSLQAMDSSHVSLCALVLRSDGFDHYRCDRTISLGLNLGNMVRVACGVDFVRGSGHLPPTTACLPCSPPRHAPTPHVTGQDPEVRRQRRRCDPQV